MKKSTQKRVGSALKAAAAAGVFQVLLIFLLCLLWLIWQAGPPASLAQDNPAPVLTPPPPGLSEGRDRAMMLNLLLPDGTVTSITLEDYLRGVLAAEMPASFHPEALKAQAVAARTYCIRKQGAGSQRHPQADICTDFACCQAWISWEEATARWGRDAARYGEKISQAVTDTDGLVCLYDGWPIDAVFFASAAGKTSDAKEVWGSEIPYLVSVASPEGDEVPGWHSEAVFSPAEFAEKIHAAHPEADLTGPVSTWLTGLSTDESGAVAGITIGGVNLTGPEVRSILGLRSAHFVPAATDDALTFSVTGHGHGVGMSQYGANALAAQGKDFRDILSWYYTGITIDHMPQ